MSKKLGFGFLVVFMVIIIGTLFFDGSFNDDTVEQRQVSETVEVSEVARRVSELLTALSQDELDYLLLSFDVLGTHLPDFIESAPPDFIDSYSLRSVNGGEWYAIRFVDDVAVDILGTAEEVYPELLDHLEANGVPVNSSRAQEVVGPALGVAEFIASLSQEALEYLLLSYNIHAGGREFVGIYFLRSINGGEWYVTTWPDAETIGEVFGVAEEIYPGLVDLLEANRDVSHYQMANRRIPQEESEQTEEEKALLAARAAAQQQFEELNKKE